MQTTLRTLKIGPPNFWVGIRNISDYSPFGVLLPERTVESANFRRGFQAQEHDDEVKGEGNSVNFKYRMHDPRVGRFFAVDPLSANYSYNSCYAFSENKLIAWVELEGLESYYGANGKYIGSIGTSKEQRVLNSTEAEKHVKYAMYKENHKLTVKFKQHYQYDLKMAYKNSHERPKYEGPTKSDNLGYPPPVLEGGYTEKYKMTFDREAFDAGHDAESREGKDPLTDDSDAGREPTFGYGDPDEEKQKSKVTVEDEHTTGPSNDGRGYDSVKIKVVRVEKEGEKPYRVYYYKRYKEGESKNQKKIEPINEKQ